MPQARSRHLRPAALILALGLVMWTAAPRLWAEWSRNPNCGHVPLALPLAMFALIRSLRQSGQDRGRPAGWLRPAGLLALASLALYADAVLAEPLLLAAGLWLAGLAAFGLRAGRPGLRRVRFAFLLLAFSIPLPDLVARSLAHIHLQRISSACAAGLLSISGCPAAASGTVIMVGDMGINVDEACSGLQFVTALLFLALLAGELMLRGRLFMRVLLAALALPVAFFANVARLVAGGWIAAWADMERALAFLHGWSVWPVYLAGIGLLLFAARALAEAGAAPAEGEPAGDQPELLAEPSRSTEGPAPASPLARPWRMRILAAWLLAAGSLPWWASRRAVQVQGPDLAAAGLELAGGRWQGRDSPLDPLSRWPGGWYPLRNYDDVRSRIYRNQQGVEVEAQVFYSSRRGANNRLVLNYINCLHGHFPEVRSREASMPGAGDAALLYLKKEGAAATVLYWFQTPGLATASRLRLLADLYAADLRHERSDGCLVKLAMTGQSAANDRVLEEIGPLVRASVAEWLERRAFAGAGSSH